MGDAWARSPTNRPALSLMRELSLTRLLLAASSCQGAAMRALGDGLRRNAVTRGAGYHGANMNVESRPAFVAWHLIVARSRTVGAISRRDRDVS